MDANKKSTFKVALAYECPDRPFGTSRIPSVRHRGRDF